MEEIVRRMFNKKGIGKKKRKKKRIEMIRSGRVMKVFDRPGLFLV